MGVKGLKYVTNDYQMNEKQIKYNCELYVSDSYWQTPGLRNYFLLS